MSLKYQLLFAIIVSCQEDKITRVMTRNKVLTNDMLVCSGNETLTVKVTINQENDQLMNCVCKINRTLDPLIRDDYNHTPGIGSHKLHTDGKIWNDARKICIEEGGHLAIINSIDEEEVSLLIM